MAGVIPHYSVAAYGSLFMIEISKVAARPLRFSTLIYCIYPGYKSILLKAMLMTQPPYH